VLTGVGLQVDQRVLSDIIAFHDPHVFDHLTQREVQLSAVWLPCSTFQADSHRDLIHQISIQTFTISWFLCLFMEAPLVYEDGLVFW